MIKRIFFLLIAFFVFIQIGVSQNSFTVEKLGELNSIKTKNVGPMGVHPNGICVDEKNLIIEIIKYTTDGSYMLKLQDNTVTYVGDGEFLHNFSRNFKRLGIWTIGDSTPITIIKDSKKTVKIILRSKEYLEGGICFILKKENAYINFFINGFGNVHAVDTDGKLYTSQEVIEFLKKTYPEKFLESQYRARELGLESDFLSGKVLVWGQTYYSTSELVTKFWNKGPLYPYNSYPIQYDLQGNGYMLVFNEASPSDFRIVDSNANIIAKIDVTPFSKILSVDHPIELSLSGTIGFGGNIYFYTAGDKYTEVFRIRRTWGEPDMYALAVNGFTSDSYGEYVKKVLLEMNLNELRLLRNYLYALYGYVFKDLELGEYFNKQVWYLPDTAITQQSIVLPKERQTLLEMIIQEESKR